MNESVLQTDQIGHLRDTPEQKKAMVDAGSRKEANITAFELQSQVAPATLRLLAGVPSPGGAGVR